MINACIFGCSKRFLPGLYRLRQGKVWHLLRRLFSFPGRPSLPAPCCWGVARVVLFVFIAVAKVSPRCFPFHYRAAAGGEEGSVFLQAVAKYLREEYRTRTLQDIFLMVKQAVIKINQVKNENTHKAWLPCGDRTDWQETARNQLETSTLSQRKGRAPQPSITLSCQAGAWCWCWWWGSQLWGVGGGGGCPSCGGLMVVGGPVVWGLVVVGGLVVWGLVVVGGPVVWGVGGGGGSSCVGVGPPHQQGQHRLHKTDSTSSRSA